jgi:VWFA-related protein
MASAFFNKFYIVLLSLMLMACGGGGGGDGSGSPAPTPAANIHLAQSNIDFAGIVVDSSSDRTFELKNTGNADLKIAQIPQANLPFNISIDGCSNMTLSPSQTCSMKVRFSPTNDGSFTATLPIPSNDPDASTVNCRLSGVGYGLNLWINKVNSSSCPSISVDVTVTNPRSASLLNLLTEDNFQLYQNGQLQNITVTGIEYPSPVSLALALDWSRSELDIISTIQAAATSFIDQLDSGSRAAIYKFNGEIDYYPDPVPPFIAGDASGKTNLNTYISTSLAHVGGTLLYDALIQAIDTAAQGTTDKRAVIVLSDGIDEGSVYGFDQVIASAIAYGIPVFAIFYVDPNFTSSGETETGMAIMQSLASESGGQYYDGLTSDLVTVFQQISRVLSNKYTLNYTSSTCSGRVSLDVRSQWDALQGRETRAPSFP